MLKLLSKKLVTIGRAFFVYEPFKKIMLSKKGHYKKCPPDFKLSGADANRVALLNFCPADKYLFLMFFEGII